MNRLLRSTGFWTGVRYAALFSVSALILFGVVYWKTAGYMESQLRSVVNDQVQFLVADFMTKGADGLRKDISYRVANRSGSVGWYELFDDDGVPLAGNLPSVSRREGWTEMRLPGQTANTDVDDDEGPAVLGRGLVLDDGSFLFVGADAYQLDEMRDLVAGALAWGFGATVLLAAIGAAVMGGAALRRIDTINTVAGEIIQGDLARRIPVRGSGDEFDVLAEHLNHMLERIQALMNSMREVTADIAHDLRTPLGRLRQRLESARREAASMEEYGQAIDRAIEEVDGIIETFAAVLRIAQIESGSRRSRFADLDLGAVLASVAEVYQPVAEESGHALHASIQSGVRVRGDRDLLVQLFANLIENALRHTPVGSRIEVELHAGPGGKAVVVADDGPGIPREALGKVTQRFYRMEASRSTPGSGLGLSLVSAIADLHGATLELGDNRPGLRATLRFAEV